MSQGLLWLQKHVGLPFPLQDPFIAAWNRVESGHSSQQASPLRISALFCLCRLASQNSSKLAAFCGFTLLPLVACLRFAHLQRSHSLLVQGPFLQGTCFKGKARRMGSRPPFSWACPVDILGFRGVFRAALQVHSKLLKIKPEARFVIPDIDLGPDGISDASSWFPRKMSRAKFVRILQSVLRRAGLGNQYVSSVSTYSLRRFLPSLADVCRCPEHLALHLGNWSEGGGKASKLQMHHLYADDKVRTAADTL